MEEEIQQQVKNETKKFNFKKYFPIIGIAAIVIIIILIFTSIFGGGPKNTVKKYISGINRGSAKKIVKSLDFVGAAAWGYSYDEDEFDKDDYKEFIEDYKEYKKEAKENKKDFEDEMDEMIDEIDEILDEINDESKSYKIEIESFKNIEKLGKDLYTVTTILGLERELENKDKEFEAEVVTFIIYKDKIIYDDGMIF